MRTVSIELCPACPCRYAVGLPFCPNCGAPAPQPADRVSEEDVPRITVAEGPTNPMAQPGETGYVDPEGSEQPSPGISSSTSADRPEQSSSETRTLSDPPPPAPTTENPSSPDPQANPASGSADSTDGSTPETGSAPNPPRGSSTASRKARARTAASPSSTDTPET